MFSFGFLGLGLESQWLGRPSPWDLVGFPGATLGGGLLRSAFLLSCFPFWIFGWLIRVGEVKAVKVMNDIFRSEADLQLLQLASALFDWRRQCIRLGLLGLLGLGLLVLLVLPRNGSSRKWTFGFGH